VAGSESKAITIKTPAELDRMRRANEIVAGVLALLASKIRPGVSTWQLDRWAEAYCREQGGEPAFLGYRGFPGSLCVSVNEQVVHGIPSKRVKLAAGDIVSLDFGVRFEGYYGDAAVTVPVGQVRPEVQRLLEVTREALRKGIEQVRPGNRVRDISRAIQDHAEAHGYGVVRQFVGHGIGAQLHEAPEVPNYVQRGPSPRLRPGMVLAIEPMINLGTHKVRVLADRWTVVTADGLPSAHFEHSVAVTEDGCEVLSMPPDGRVRARDGG